jgi:hypothetical protein
LIEKKKKKHFRIFTSDLPTRGSKTKVNRK